MSQLKANMFKAVIIALVVLAQLFIVRHFWQGTNQKLSQLDLKIDTSIPHPSSDYEPKQVVQLMLYALKYNHQPRPDSGFKACWQLMSPRLRGELRSQEMLKPFLGPDWIEALTDYESYELSRETVAATEASYEITLRSPKRLERRMVLGLKKLQDFWLIDLLVKK